MSTSRNKTLTLLGLTLLCVFGLAYATGSEAPSAEPKVTASLDRFEAFRSPAAGELPSQLRDFAAAPDMQQRFGLDVSAIRRIDGVGGKAWYLLPGTDSLCFYDGAGGGCTSLEEALAGKLLVILRPPPTLDGSAPVSPASTRGVTNSDDVIIRGVVPAGVTSVRASGANGSSTTAAVSGGAYEISGSAIQSLAFVGPNTPAPVRLAP